jgi:hypothetical protein
MLRISFFVYEVDISLAIALKKVPIDDIYIYPDP